MKTSDVYHNIYVTLFWRHSLKLPNVKNTRVLSILLQGTLLFLDATSNDENQNRTLAVRDYLMHGYTLRLLALFDQKQYRIWFNRFFI